MELVKSSPILLCVFDLAFPFHSGYTQPCMFLLISLSDANICFYLVEAFSQENDQVRQESDCLVFYFSSSLIYTLIIMKKNLLPKHEMVHRATYLLLELNSF